MHACMHTYIHTYIHTYMHACMHACIHTYIHTYILLLLLITIIIMVLIIQIIVPMAMIMLVTMITIIIMIMPRLRTTGVNTNGAAAKNNNEFRRIGEKGAPWHFGEYTSRLTGVITQKVPVKMYKIRSDPISADPICPFPKCAESTAASHAETIPYLFCIRPLLCRTPAAGCQIAVSQLLSSISRSVHLPR